MTLTQKMLNQNGIKTTDTNSQDNSNDNGGQSGSGSAGENGSEAGGAGGEGSANSNAADGNTDKGAGAAGGSGNSNGNDGGGSGSAADTPLSTEALLKGLEERGIKVKSLDELAKPSAEQTAEEKEQQETQRRNNIRSHALGKGKVKATELDAYAVESALPTADLAFAIFKRNRLAELTAAKTPEAELPTDSDLRNEFTEANFLHLDETDTRRKIAEKRMLAENDQYLQETYPAIYEMESDYDQTLEEQNLRTGYTSILTETFTGLPKETSFKVKDGDKEVQIPFKFNDAEIAAVRARFESDQMFNVLGKNKATKEAINEAVQNALKLENLDRIISDTANAIADSRLDAAGKGRRNIFNSTGGGDGQGSEKKVTPGVGKMLAKSGMKPATN